jgi:hypothetical protein
MLSDLHWRRQRFNGGSRLALLVGYFLSSCTASFLILGDGGGGGVGIQIEILADFEAGTIVNTAKWLADCTIHCKMPDV